jgi:malate dehydrogenase
VLAGALLGLALYGVDLASIWTAFLEADYRYLLPLLALILLSNLLRAWRWQILVDALPPPERPTADGLSSGRMLEASFSSVMIGYMVNYAAPRMGEVARTANLSARSDHRFSSLFGTVVSERIFDTVVLGGALVSAMGLLVHRLDVLRTQFVVPAWSRLQSLPLGWVLGGLGAAVLVGGALVLGTRWFLQREDAWAAQLWRRRVKPSLLSFNAGLATLLRSPQRGAILVSTAAMWGGYLLMAYLPFRMLHLAAPYDIGLVDAWALMAIGALGILVPSPGGIGSYHYITEQALVHLYGVPAADALTYAVLTHGAQLIFYTLAGGTVVLYQGAGLRPLLAFWNRSSPPATTDAPSSAEAQPESPPPNADPDSRRDPRVTHTRRSPFSHNIAGRADLTPLTCDQHVSSPSIPHIPQTLMKVTVIGAGNVGATVADCVAQKDMAHEVVMVDIKEGMPQGKGLDMLESSPVHGFDTTVTGANDYGPTEGSDVCIITAGLPRSPGMSRDDLLAKNTEIVGGVTEQFVAGSPDSTIIVVANPLDVMTYVAYEASGFPSNRVMGMAGVLDTARYRAFIAQALDVSVRDIQALLMGGHGDTMVPLPRYTTIGGVPLPQWLDDETIDEIVERTKGGGGEIVDLMGTSAWYAPGAAAAEMTEAILKNNKRILPAAAYCDGEYDVEDLFIGVPVKLGANGVEEIIEVELTDAEKAQFNTSAEHVHANLDDLQRLRDAGDIG